MEDGDKWFRCQDYIMGVAEGQKEILVEDEAPKERCPASLHTHTNKRQSLKAIKYFTIYICTL